MIKSLFVLIFAACIYIITRMTQIELGVPELVILSLATVRLARTLSFNTIAEFLRRPFCEVRPDSCGAGDNVHPKGTGLRYNIGELLACPICTGTWSALLMLVCWIWFRPLVYVLAIAGGAEMLHWFFDVLEWSGRATRCISGLIAPDEKDGTN